MPPFATLRTKPCTARPKTCKKCKINTEGYIISPLNAVALFAQQDTECWEKEMAEEAKKKSKTDLVLVREHQCVLTVGTKVFANPLLSYNHKDDLLDIVVTLGLDCTGTMTMLTGASKHTLLATLRSPHSPASLA